ncbi:MAG: hypothetical protein K9H48_16095 [Melioribacteraceae bacterium]|nr:hypothetical protein [Melioribacteraceae bacterium]MCF8395508.1 hypothetical protein [Melioribacteraceae bacterium]MCF8420848.1 hypothetical protein [Melioribacteraceae bacterium]
MIFRITLLFIFIAKFFIHAQNFSPTISNLTIDDGISSNVIFSIVQDDIGYLWIGTNAGLDRYDGIKFKHYHNNPFDSTSLSSNLVQHIMQDSRGRLWISTRAGLNLYNRDKDNFTNFVVDESDSDGIPNDDIWHTYETSDEILWLCTRRNGLLRFDTDQNKFNSYRHDGMDLSSIPNDRVTDIIEDNNGKIWVISVLHEKCILNKLQEDRQSFKRINIGELQSSPNVVTKDKNGFLWLGTFDSQLIKFDPASEKYQFFTFSMEKQTVRSITIDRQENIWLGTSDGGAYRFDPDGARFENYPEKFNSESGLSFKTVWDIYEDDKGIVWLGTFGGGVDKIIPEQELFNQDYIYDEKWSMLREVTSFLKLKDGTLLIGTFGNGLFIKRDKSLEQIKPQTINSIELSDNRINKIIIDKESNIWISTVISIIVLDSTLNTVRVIEEGPYATDLSSGTVNDLLPDNQGNVWAATHNGINILRNDTENVTKIFHNKNETNTILRNHVYALFLDSRNIIWIGTAAGLSSLSDDRKSYSHYIADPNGDNSIRNNFITDITEDQNANIWISTFGGGISKIDRDNEKILTFDESIGLADNRTSSIVLGNDSSIWVGTKSGLSKLDLNSNYITNFYDVQGLASNEFSGNAAYKSDDGKIYFGNINGFNSFFPEQLLKGDNGSNLILTNFRLFNRDYSFDHCIEDISKIELTYEQNFITFEFALLDYTFPKKNRYKYKLEGLDPEWIDSGNKNHADYTNIPPGNYNFRVKAANSGNNWSAKELDISLIIFPPYYQSWWFISLMTLLFFLVLFGIYKYRINEIKKLHVLRDNIHKNLHDELGSTLTSINYFARALKNNKTKHAKYLENIITSSDDARERIKDMMWVVNPKNDSVKDLFSRVRRFASDIFEANNIEYEIVMPTVDYDFKVSMQSRQNFWLIIKELIANIIKHSKAGKVKLMIQMNDHDVCIWIEDDGIGFDVQKVKNGEGLKNISSRIKEMNGVMKLDSAEREGTHYNLRFNLNKK